MTYFNRPFFFTILLGLIAAFTFTTPLFAERNSLLIYWIDVEGGAATLLVTPMGQSILMDTGWHTSDNRDATRIVAAMRDAEIDRIDFLITSHFHRDHVGGIAAFANQVEIGQFVDHGDSVEQADAHGEQLFKKYLDVARARRRVVTAGDRLQVSGIDFSFVVSHRVIRERISSMGENPLCTDRTPSPPDLSENGHSLGYLLSLGGFQFLNLGDLTPDVQYSLACPESSLPPVDILQVPHHGNGLAPELIWALSPNVAIVANGPHKGGSSLGYEIISQSPALNDIWQLHYSLDNESIHNTDHSRIANLTDERDCQGHWLKATVAQDGRSYSVATSRDSNSISYDWR